MRLIACLICLFPSAALAETVESTSRLTDVTIFSGGARLIREVTVEGPAGLMDLVVTDLPELSDGGQSLRLDQGDGLVVGAFSLNGDGVPPVVPRLSLAQQAAEDRVKSLEAEEREALGSIDEINARLAAGNAKAGFLQSLGSGGLDLGSATADSLKAIADMAGAEMLAARQEAVAAQADLLLAQAALTEVQLRLERARLARDDLATPDAVYPTLRLSVTKATDAPTVLKISYFDDRAGWTPVYDADLNRKEGRVTLGRGILVGQETGEDWAGVHLTLSTAVLGGQNTPSQLWPDARRIEPEQTEESDDMRAMASMDEPSVMAEAPVAAVMATPTLVGDTVVYEYPEQVNVASGSETVHLALDVVTLTAEAKAVAVPRQDQTAFLVATLTNSSDEILLPGPVNLLRDGALVGTSEIELLAPGVEAEFGFGPIEGLRLTRNMPERAEGERGILTSSNQIEEKATLTVENKTGESWPVRVLDQVPYSEQEDLKITFTADPAPTETDVEGQRGMLAWEFDLEAGATRDIQLNHTISWPQGMVLQ